MKTSSNLKYIMYCRKSTESDERQQLSIEAQKERLKKYAEDNNLRVVQVLTESKSAYHPGRPVFNQMLDLIKAEKANAILVWQLNRLSRNFQDMGSLLHMFSSGELIELRTHSDGVYTEKSDSQLVAAIQLSLSKKSSDDNSESVKRGNRAKILGGWATHSRNGYMFIDHPQTGERILAPDPDRFPVLQKAFRQVLSGKRVSEVHDLLNNEWGYRTPKPRKGKNRLGGRPLAISSFYRILNDEFYCGWLYTADGEKVKGKHEPMISEAEYNQIQKILGDKGRARPQHVELPYRAMISCGECGCTVCGEDKEQTICSECKTKFASKTKKVCRSCGTPISKMSDPTHLHYVYFRCTKKKRDKKCSQKTINLKDLTTQLQSFLDKIELSDDLHEWTLGQLKKHLNTEFQTHNQIRTNLQKNLDKVEANLEHLIKTFTDIDNRDEALLSKQEYLAQKEFLQKEKEKTITELRSSALSTDTLIERAENVFEFTKIAHQRYRKGDYQVKTDIIQSLGSNLILENRKVRAGHAYPWLFFKEANENLALHKQAGLEPRKSIDIYDNTGVVDEVVSTLQGRKDSNLHERFWRPPCYH